MPERETDEQRLSRTMDELDRQTVTDRWGRVGVRNPMRPAALAGLALTVVLVVLMLTVGDVRVGRWPLAERLLAWTMVTCPVALAAGLLMLLLGQRRPRVRRWARLLLSVAFATFLAFCLVLALALARVLPLNLEGVLGGAS